MWSRRKKELEIINNIKRNQPPITEHKKYLNTTVITYVYLNASNVQFDYCTAAGS
jgi:hypothetical protein